MSNDLQHPLKAIRANASQLMENPPEKISAQERDIIQQIDTDATLVDQRINDLLAISLINRQKIQLRQVSAKSVAEKALNTYAREIKEYQIKAQVKDLPPCQADPELLEQVFSNLIGNAIKFTREVENPEITVGAQPSASPDKVIYYVRDNGIGFKMKDQDKVFQTFGKLHSDSEYQGSGVGLAVAKIIINKHGGMIWAEAKKDAGATFYFELPLSTTGMKSTTMV
jgi:light-regulated signal transduction histidine kinase (bacteriophytochrome)